MKQSLLYRFFPPPKFLRMPITGVDISDESVHIAELENTPEGKKIKKFDKRLIPKGLIEDGYIKDAKKIKAFFTKLRRDHNLHFVNVSLPEQHGYVVVVRIPKVQPDEIYNNLELQIEEHVPIPVNEATFAYDIIRGGDPNDDLAFIELNVTVYPREIVEEYMDVFLGTGLVPLRFEVESHAVSRTVVPEDDDGTFMVLDFGKTRTGITIVNNGAVQFTSTIGIGGDMITRAVARNFSISFEEAERLKTEKGFLVGEGDENMLLALMPTVSALKDEVGKHYQYWNNHDDVFGKKRQKIDTLLLCGGLANFKGLPEYLASNIHTNVRVANIFGNINSFENYIPSISFEKSLQYATSIGLALSSSR